MRFPENYWSWSYSYQKSTITFNAIRPLQFSYPLYLIHEIENSPRFFSYGTLRQSESHVNFFYTVRGHGICWRGEERHRVGPSEAFLNIVNEANSGYTYPSDANDEWQFYVLSFSGGNSLEMTKYLIDTYGIRYSIPHSSSVIKEIEYLLREHKMLDNMGLECSASLSLADGMTLINQVFSTLLNIVLPNSKTQYAPLVDEALRLIQANRQRCPSVSELAMTMNVSREHLSRVFRQNVGVPLSGYISNQQIRIARYLLEHEACSIAEIAERLGYSTPAAFSTAFKRITNLSPAKYRELRVSQIADLSAASLEK